MEDKKIRCIVVDDEAYAIEIIAGFIAKVPNLQLVGKTTDPVAALSMLTEKKVNLVFLDIQMPALTGLQFIKIVGNSCKIILTTAYPEYALEGYENDVIDYLLKPISFERFLKAVNKVNVHFNDGYLLIDKDSTSEKDKDFIFVKGETKNKFIKVDLQEILYIAGLKNYVSIVLQTQRLVIYIGISELEEQLPKNQFIRVHKSYIVAVNKIRMVDGHTVFIGTEKIPIGAVFKNQLYKKIRT